MQLSLSVPTDREAHGKSSAVLWTDQDYRPRLPGVYAMKYMMAARDPTPARDLAWYQVHHPEWVARRCDGSPAHEFKYDWGYFTPVDIGNPAVRAYLVQEALGVDLHTGRFDAVSVDNLDAQNPWGRCGVMEPAGFRRLSSGAKNDPAYLAMTIDWMTALRAQVNAAGLCLAGNDYFEDDSARGFLAIAKTLDIVVDEHGFTRRGLPLSLDRAWLGRMRAYQSLPATKPLVIIDYPAETVAALNPAGLSWSIANFLLVKRTNSYLSVSSLDVWDRWQSIPALDLPLGSPLEPMQIHGGVYTRRFEHLIAAVNPSSRLKGRYELPQGSWRGLDGDTYAGAIDLAPATAAILWRVG